MFVFGAQPARKSPLFMDEPLLLDVLARLSPRTLARAKLVCRQWNDAARGALTLRAIARVDAAADRDSMGCLLGPEAVHKGLHPVILREVCDGSLCRYLGWRLGWYGLEDVSDDGCGVQSAAGWGGGGSASGSGGIDNSAGGRLIFRVNKTIIAAAVVATDPSSDSHSSRTDHGSAKLLTFPLPAPLCDVKSWKQEDVDFAVSPQGRLVATWSSMARVSSPPYATRIHFLSINDGRTGAPLLAFDLGGSYSGCERVFWSRCGCFLALAMWTEELYLIDLASSFLGRGAWSGLGGGGSGGCEAAAETPRPPRAAFATDLSSALPSVAWSAPSSARLYMIGEDGVAQFWEACSDDGGRLKWADCPPVSAAGGIVSDGQPLLQPGTAADGTVPFFRVSFDQKTKERTTAALLHPGMPLLDGWEAVVLRDDLRSRNALFGPGVAYDAATLSERLVLPLHNSLVAWLWRRQRRLARAKARRQEKGGVGGGDEEEEEEDDDAAAVLGPILRYDPDEHNGQLDVADEVHQMLFLDAARPVDALQACLEKGWSKQKQGDDRADATPNDEDDDSGNNTSASAKVAALLPWLRAHEDLMRRAITNNYSNLQHQLEAAVRGVLRRSAPGVAFSSAVAAAVSGAPMAALRAVKAPARATAAELTPQTTTPFFSTALGATYDCRDLAVRPQGGLVAFVCSASGRLYLRCTAALGAEQPQPPPTLQVYPPPNRAAPPLAQGPAGPGVIVPSIPWRGGYTEPSASLGQWSPCGRRLLFFGSVGVASGSNDRIRVPMVLELPPDYGTAVGIGGGSEQGSGSNNDNALPARLRLLVIRQGPLRNWHGNPLAWSTDGRAFCLEASIDPREQPLPGKPLASTQQGSAVQAAVVVRLADDGGKGFWEGALDEDSNSDDGNLIYGLQWSLFDAAAPASSPPNTEEEGDRDVLVAGSATVRPGGCGGRRVPLLLAPAAEVVAQVVAWPIGCRSVSWMDGGGGGAGASGGSGGGGDGRRRWRRRR